MKSAETSEINTLPKERMKWQGTNFYAQGQNSYSRSSESPTPVHYSLGDLLDDDYQTYGPQLAKPDAPCTYPQGSNPLSPKSIVERRDGLGSLAPTTMWDSMTECHR